MCGIIGVIGKTPDTNTNPLLCQIKHRGPDSDGSFSAENIYLGHVRLAIQDLSVNGSQPMYSSDKKYVIVFNGEIYNHFDIRNQLLSDVQFTSTSDTETVLYGYIKYGSEILGKLNGIFALAIYNTAEKEIFIARDQYGIKPLYLYTDTDKMIFSSEIKTLLPIEFNKEIDLEGMVNYLTFLWSPGVKTPFRQVKKLLPGHYLHSKAADFGIAVPQQYYYSSFNGTYSNLTETQLVDELDVLLQKAVQRQMLSDVPVGFFLSGGLDSTLLVAIAKRLYPGNKFKCFTIDIDSWSDKEENFVNDIQYAKKAAEVLDVDLRIVETGSSIVRDFDKMIWHLDEPQADPAPLNVYRIAELARTLGIKVLIGGTAGDDIFSGYRRHQALNLEKYYRFIPAFGRKLIKKIIQGINLNRPIVRQLKKLTSSIELSSLERLKNYFVWFPVSKVKKLFNNTSRKAVNNYDPLAYFDRLLLEIPRETSKLNQMLFLETRSFLVDHNLNYTDKMGMAVGVEIRVPYLDLELVAFAEKIPPHLKLKGRQTKYLLKKVAERYLPHEIIYRPKTGFGAPIRKWVNEELSDMVRERLSKEALDKGGIFDYEAVKQLIDDNRAGKIDAAYTIWTMLAIQSWISQFVTTEYTVKK